MLRENKRVRYAALLLLLGIGIILMSVSSGNTENTEEQMSLDEYRAMLEGEVAELCSAVDGVGKCKVFITFERGAQSTYKGSALIECKPPRVLGVCVACKGAESDKVERELSDMLTALFDIGYNRVAIMKLN